jgi:hypothetical protein
MGPETFFLWVPEALREKSRREDFLDIERRLIGAPVEV